MRGWGSLRQGGFTHLTRTCYDLDKLPGLNNPFVQGAVLFSLIHITTVWQSQRYSKFSKVSPKILNSVFRNSQFLELLRRYYLFYIFIHIWSDKLTFTTYFSPLSIHFRYSLRGFVGEEPIKIDNEAFVVLFSFHWKNIFTSLQKVFRFVEKSRQLKCV